MMQYGQRVYLMQRKDKAHFLTVAVTYIEMKPNGIWFCLLCILQRPIILYSFTAHASWARGRASATFFFSFFFLNFFFFFFIFFFQLFLRSHNLYTEREREWGLVSKCWKVPKWSSARKATAKATGKTAKEEQKAEGEWCENKKCFPILSDIWGYSLIRNPISLSQSQHTPHSSFSILYTDTHTK